MNSHEVRIHVHHLSELRQREGERGDECLSLSLLAFPLPPGRPGGEWLPLADSEGTESDTRLHRRVANIVAEFVLSLSEC